MDEYKSINCELCGKEFCLNMYGCGFTCKVCDKDFCNDEKVERCGRYNSDVCKNCADKND